jgi:hypothetical protein
MIAFKSCPRCHGDVMVDRYDEATCLQCGHDLRPAEKAVLFERIEARRRKLPVAA